MDKITAIDGTYPTTVTIESGGNSWRVTIPAGVIQVERTGRWEPEDLARQKPPLFLQCDQRWRNLIYAPGGSLTFCRAGCLVTCVASLAMWAGMVTDPAATAAAEMLGLDLLTVANEGRLVAVVEAAAADQAVNILAAHEAAPAPVIIGNVGEAADMPLVEMVTTAGGRRIVQMPYGEDLPRIC